MLCRCIIYAVVYPSIYFSVLLQTKRFSRRDFKPLKNRFLLKPRPHRRVDNNPDIEAIQSSEGTPQTQTNATGRSELDIAEQKNSAAVQGGDTGISYC
mmetsp:Transcript_24914/g.58459  ORF Transcript_24914/g.58459 Transcript_24914/m.58459 type:complete len:98 (-) Transcript_24914:67-360(-)